MNEKEKRYSLDLIAPEQREAVLYAALECAAADQETEEAPLEYLLDAFIGAGLAVVSQRMREADRGGAAEDLEAVNKDVVALPQICRNQSCAHLQRITQTCSLPSHVADGCALRVCVV